MTRSFPALVLREVVVSNDQTGAGWLPEEGRIVDGSIHVDATRAAPPAGFFDSPAHTYTVSAVDGGGRARRFVQSKYVAEASDGAVIVFR